jgi:hypothetical protein
MLLQRNTFALHKKGVALPIAFFLCFLFIPVFYSHGGEHIVLYRLGAKDPAVWDQLRRYLGAKGYRVSMFDGSDSIERHIENVNRINKLGASVFIAVDLGVSDQNRAVIAVTTAKKGRGNILAIDEIPALYANESRELATSLASMFNKGVKEIPLFPLLGVDMPGLYVKIDYTPDKTSEVLEKFHEGLRRYFRRGKNDER